MLSVNDLIDINYIPAEDEISLQLLVDFYEEYLCKRIFIYTLKNGKVIKLLFKDGTEIFHISGIDHVYEGVPMDGKRFLQGVKNKEIDLKTVENVNAAAYKDYIVRIRSMACLDTIIKRCEYLWYPEGKIPETTIEVRYLLLKGLDEKNLHLGIDTYKEKRPYFSRTLLVTEGNSSDKFIGVADERLRVAKLEIRDKDTDDLLLCIDREAAEKKALETIRKYADEWFLNDFQTLIFKHFLEVANKKLYEMWIQNLNYEMLCEFNAFDSDIETAFEIKEDSTDNTEWKNLYLEVLDEKLSDKRFVSQILSVTIREVKNYEEILHSSITRTIRDEWKANFKRIIDEKRSDMRCVIEELDCYTSGKILGEAIRGYEKDELKVQLIQRIIEVISQTGKNMICDILLDEIIQQKEDVLKRISLLVC